MDSVEKHHQLISSIPTQTQDPSSGVCVLSQQSYGSHHTPQDISRCFSSDFLDNPLLYPYLYSYPYSHSYPYYNDDIDHHGFNNHGHHHRFRELPALDASFGVIVCPSGEQIKRKLPPPYFYKPKFNGQSPVVSGERDIYIRYHTDCSINEIPILHSTFLNVCNVNSQVVLPQQPVLFDMSNAIYGNCGFVSNDSNISIWKSGYYLICISNEIVNGFAMCKNGEVMNELFMGTNMIIKITNDNLVEPVSLSTSGLGCNLQIVNNTDNAINLSNVSFSLLLINDV